MVPRVWFRDEKTRSESTKRELEQPAEMMVKPMARIFPSQLDRTVFQAVSHLTYCPAKLLIDKNPPLSWD